MQREKTMLIADDVELNRALLENIFEDEYSILQAADGAEAMESCAASRLMWSYWILSCRVWTDLRF